MYNNYDYSLTIFINSALKSWNLDFEKAFLSILIILWNTHEYIFFSVVHGLYFDDDSGSTFLIVDACGPGKKDAPPNYLIKIPHENRNFEIHFDQNVGEASEILKQEPKKSVDKFIFTILKTKYVNAYKGYLALYIWY